MRRIALLFLGLALVLFVFSYVYAADYLNMSATGILPSNPFYVFKEMWRAVEKFFIFNSIKRAEFELNVLDEKAVELKTVIEKDPWSSIDISKAILNYQQSVNSTTDHLVALKNLQTSQNAGDLINRAEGQLQDGFNMLEYLQYSLTDHLDLNKDEVENLKIDITQNINSLK